MAIAGLVSENDLTVPTPIHLDGISEQIPAAVVTMARDALSPDKIWLTIAGSISSTPLTKKLFRNTRHRVEKINGFLTTTAPPSMVFGRSDR